MIIKRLRLENWRNFLRVDVVLQNRVFIVGPNASGKSNLLDALRFLRDIADPQGGLQRAVHARRGVSQIRSLHARRRPYVVIDVLIEIDRSEWNYRLEFTQDNLRRATVSREVVTCGSTPVVERPDRDDAGDPSRLSQTYLEQVNANKPFREIAEFLSQIRYLHLVPQLIREPDRSVGRSSDPYGGDFLEQLARTQRVNRRVYESRMRRIADALRIAMPQLKELRLAKDDRGVAHLQFLYEHWRPNAGWQTEDQFSDGTLRLLGLLWVLLDGAAPLLLEEPELSLHEAVVSQIPRIMARVARKQGRQTIVSTHSAQLLSDEGIDPAEVLVLEPTAEGTEVTVAVSDDQIRSLLAAGLSMADAVIPRTAPRHALQLSLFGD
ncbi:MAG TPA: AAA family ATPase [Vicinamibacterales bacterium]|nr:AAA family ATPase [Vicinamibacterales bacterium]